MAPKATTRGALRREVEAGRLVRRPVKSEIRDNLIRKLRSGETLFPGIIGYDDSVVPQVVNAILSRHNFILLGLRGQAKTRLLRAMTSLLDEWLPVVPGCEIHDDPLEPLCAACRARLRAEGDDLPVDPGVRDLPEPPIQNKAKTTEMRPQYLAATNRAPAMAKWLATIVSL